MRRTIYLPDDLGDRVEAYLSEHPGRTFSSVVQEALEERLVPPDPRRILQLAGLIEHSSTTAREYAEDRHVRRER